MWMYSLDPTCIGAWSLELFGGEVTNSFELRNKIQTNENRSESQETTISIAGDDKSYVKESLGAGTDKEG